MILAGTGHRPERTGGYDKIARRELEDFASLMLKLYRPTRVISGMALGWDQALAVAAYRAGIPFDAYVPFDGQEGRWPSHAQARYHRIISAAENVKVVSGGGFSSQAMQARNEAMVDNATAILALWDGVKSGGTWNCMLYARNKGVRVCYAWQHWVSWQSGEHLI